MSATAKILQMSQLKRSHSSSSVPSPNSLSKLPYKSTVITFDESDRAGQAQPLCCSHFLTKTPGIVTFFFPPFSFWQHRSTSVCSGNQSSVTTAHPQQWQVQNEKYSRPWLIDFGATREQAVLSLRCGPWALEWNGQKGSLLWDECGKPSCFWSSRAAENWVSTVSVVAAQHPILQLRYICRHTYWW